MKTDFQTTPAQRYIFRTVYAEWLLTNKNDFDSLILSILRECALKGIEKTLVDIPPESKEWGASVLLWKDEDCLGSGVYITELGQYWRHGEQMQPTHWSAL